MKTRTCLFLVLTSCLLLVSLNGCNEGDETAKFVPGPTNPIITDNFTADPAPIVVGDTLYLVVGKDELPPSSDGGVGGEWFRITKWLMYSTKDMKKFTLADVENKHDEQGVILNSEDFTFGSVVQAAKARFAWASQIIQGRDGKFYFYVTLELPTNERVVGVAVADDILGPYDPQPAPVVRVSWVTNDTGLSNFNDKNIDPTALIDTDGTAYLMWGQSPLIAELISDKDSPDYMIKLKRTIDTAKNPIWRWAGYAKSSTTPDPASDNPFTAKNPNGWQSEDQYDEGPYLFKRGNWYYMFYPSGIDQAGHERISYSMAPTIKGPWTDGKRITDGAPALKEQYSFTTHPGVVEFKGQTYLFYHNATLSVPQEDGTIWEGATARRSVAVEYLYFNEDGTIPFVTLSKEGLSVPPKSKQAE